MLKVEHWLTEESIRQKVTGSAKEKNRDETDVVVSIDFEPWKRLSKSMFLGSNWPVQDWSCCVTRTCEQLSNLADICPTATDSERFQLLSRQIKLDMLVGGDGCMVNFIRIESSISLTWQWRHVSFWVPIASHALHELAWPAFESTRLQHPFELLLFVSWLRFCVSCVAFFEEWPIFESLVPWCMALHPPSLVWPLFG